MLVGASNGKDVDYHLMPVSLHDPEENPLTFRAKAKLLNRSKNSMPNPGLKTVLAAMKFLATPSSDATMFVRAAFLLRSNATR